MEEDERRLFMHRTLADAHLSEVDALKRITIPMALLQHAGIERRAVVVGMFNRLELWEPNVWSEYLDAREDIEVPSIEDLSRSLIREVS
jgi:MraZ protein